jgi:hypothetical protein
MLFISFEINKTGYLGCGGLYSDTVVLQMISNISKETTAFVLG